MLAGLIEAHVFDSIHFSLFFEGLSTGLFGAYLFESKVETVFQSHFKILTVLARIVSFAVDLAGTKKAQRWLSLFLFCYLSSEYQIQL